MTTNSPSTFDINSLLIQNEYILEEAEFYSTATKKVPLRLGFLSLLSVLISARVLYKLLNNLGNTLEIVLYLLFFAFVLSFTIVVIRKLLRTYKSYKQCKKVVDSHFKPILYLTNVRLIIVESPNWYKVHYYKDFIQLEVMGKKIFYMTGKDKGFLELEDNVHLIETFQWLSAHIAGNDAQFTHTYHFKKSQKKNSLKKSWAMAHRKRLLRKV